jgi:hypothetical protein
MIPGTKNEEPFLLFVPVAAHAAEYRCTIKEGVRCNADLRLGEGDDLPFEEYVTLSCHRHTSRVG